MDSFALWYTPKTGIDNKIIDVEVHLNLWKLKHGRKGGESLDHFLDIGVMIEDIEKVSNVNIFIPSRINKGEIIDLGSYFKEHTDLVPLIFNRDYVVKTTQVGKSVEVLNRDNELQFNIIKLDTDTDLEIIERAYGSIIRIAADDTINKGKTYYRIRIKSDFIESLSSIDKPANAILESAFACTEIVDFRLNEKRNLHSSLLNEIHKDGEVNFKPIHLFVMREANFDYIFSSGKLYRSRILEKDLWTQYVGSNYSFKKIIAYQWMEESSETAYAFVKFRFRRSNLKTIFSFLFWALLVAIVGGVIGSILVSIFITLIRR